MFFPVVLPHLLEVSDLVTASLFDLLQGVDNTKYNWVIVDFINECMVLDRLIVGSFAGLTENARAVLPSPELS
jgi:hypothetical protein